MRAFVAIYLKEMRTYLSSPIAYALMVAYLAITGYFFYTAAAQYAFLSLQAMQNPMLANMKLHQFLVGPLLGNQSIILLLIIPLLTMRLLSEEKRTGTIELLLSYPLGDSCVVLAKFAAAWTMVALMLLFSGRADGSFVHHGTSALVRHPGGLSGAFAFGRGLRGFRHHDERGHRKPDHIGGGVLCRAFDPLDHELVRRNHGRPGGFAVQVSQPGRAFHALPQGLLDTADLAYFVLFTFFFLFVGIRNLEAKRWKA